MSDDDYEDDYEDDFEEETSNKHGKIALQRQLAKKEQEITVLKSSLAEEREALRKQRVLIRSLRDDMSNMNGGNGAPSASSGRRAGRRGSVANSENDNKPLLEIPCREIQYTDIKLGEEISGGGFCILYEGTWVGTPIAVKRIFDPVITDELKAEFANEVQMLHTLRHPCVVNMLGACSRPPNLVIVTEFCARGSLYHVLYNSKVQLDNKRKIMMSIQAAAALWFLHTAGIVHRDVKTHNFLADELLRIKICDFGMARTATALKNDKKPCGTPSYIPPEVWECKGAGFPTDVFAFGMVLNEIWSLEVPFDGCSPAECKKSILKGTRPTISHGVPLAVVDVIKGCWLGETIQRLSMKNVHSKLVAYQSSR